MYKPEIKDESCDLKEKQKLKETLPKLMTDRDPRVRVAALLEFQKLLHTIKEFDEILYNLIKQMTEDTCPKVRVQALLLVSMFAKTYIQTKILDVNGKSILLNDDAFSVVCQGINDPDKEVRAEAARLLGDFNIVSDDFLDQTLDKKLMASSKAGAGESVFRVKESMFSLSRGNHRGSRRGSNWRMRNTHERYRRHNNEWSTGKKLYEAAPGKQKSEDESMQIMSQGACGAFVTALEDEFKTGVYSLGKLAANRPSFALSALDHLADMFNDEIAQVRLDAIYALTPLVVHGQLKKEQLNTILKCLDDASPETRQALRTLLVKGDFADAECLRLSIRALLINMRRFPNDREQIFRCFSSLGIRHAIMVQALVMELLDLDPTFEPVERHINDLEYLAKVFLILSAASIHTPVLSILPAYVIRHYKYLRVSMPHLVPAIEHVDGLEQVENQKRLEILRKEWSGEKSEILERTYERLVSIEKEIEHVTRRHLRRLIIDDVSTISEFNAPLSSGARFIATITHICIGLESSLQQMMFGLDASKTIRQIDKELAHVMAAFSQFVELSIHSISFLWECASHLLVMKFITLCVSQVDNTPTFLDKLKVLIKEIEKVFDERKISATQSLISLLKNITDIIDDSGKEKLSSLGLLSKLLTDQPPKLPKALPEAKRIRVKWASIMEPSKDNVTEKVYRFVAGLPTVIPFSAQLHNVDENEVTQIRIQIMYPNLNESLFKPRASHITTNESEIYSINTEILITSPIGWADSAEIRLTVVLLPLSKSTLFSQQGIPLFAHPGSAEEASVSVMVHPMNNRC